MHTTDLCTPLHCDLFVLYSLVHRSYVNDDDRLELWHTFGVVVFLRDTDTVHSCGAALLEESLSACYSPSLQRASEQPY